MAPSTQKVEEPCHLLNLAPELRNKIWEYVLIPTHTWDNTQASPDLRKHSSEASASALPSLDDKLQLIRTYTLNEPLPAILRTNSQIRSETRSMFFKHNTFQIHVNLNAKSIRAWIRMMCPHLLLIERVLLTVHLLNEERVDEDDTDDCLTYIDYLEQGVVDFTVALVRGPGSRALVVDDTHDASVEITDAEVALYSILKRDRIRVKKQFRENEGASAQKLLETMRLLRKWAIDHNRDAYADFRQRMAEVMEN